MDSDGAFPIDRENPGPFSAIKYPVNMLKEQSFLIMFPQAAIQQMCRQDGQGSIIALFHAGPMSSYGLRLVNGWIWNFAIHRYFWY